MNWPPPWGSAAAVRVLVTGSEGYIGTILGPYLMARGHDVVGIDTGFHRIGWLYNGIDPGAGLDQQGHPDSDR